MQRFCCLLLILPLFIASCNSGHSYNKNESATEARWYKRYTGTVAGLPVVANLFFDGDKGANDGTVSGNYYYRGKSDLLDFEEAEMRHGRAQFAEDAPNESGDEKNKPEWTVQISDTGITGTWKSADGKKTYPVVLKESYEGGGYAFDVISMEDSVSFKGKEQEYQMTTSFNLMAPAASANKEDAQFITKAMLHELGGDTLGATDFTAYIKASNKAYFKEYLHDLTENAKDTGGWEGESNNWEETRDGTLEYNDRGIVVFGFALYDYSGGAHPNNWGRYICLDVAGRKALHLGDILNVDTVKLRGLLEQAARKKFEINPGDSLGSRLLVDTMPLTNNFIISETGITFCYNPYEIASYVDGPSAFYFSYTQLGEMVQPEFRKRMQRQ